MSPTIAVAITTYNQAHWIAGTLESVFNQSVPPAEVVVVDDGSTDDTVAVLHQFRDRVRIIRQRNAGVAAARNAAVLACSAEFVALLDGDDLWHGRKLQQCAALLRRFPEACLLAHDVETIQPNGDLIDRGDIGRKLRDRGLSDAALVECLDQLLQNNFIWTTSQVVVRHSAYMQAGLSDTAFPIASDYDLYLRLAARGRFLLAGDVLAQWRQHDASASGRGLERRFNWGVDVARVLTKASTRPEFAAHLQAISRSRNTITRLMYSSEQQYGRWAAARGLARIAWHCRDVNAAIAAGAVLLTPQRMRRAMASATGMSISRESES